MSSQLPRMSNATKVVILILFLITSLPLYEAIISRLKSRPARVKCFDELGCFTPIKPLFSIIKTFVDLFPSDRASIDTRFKLYTSSNTKTPYVFSNIYGNLTESINKSTFNPKADLKFIIPGFMSVVCPGWKNILIDALLLESCSNVFLVDWQKGDGPIYAKAVANTKVVGAEIALFIKRLQSLYGVQPDQIHLIGHSCGSHIAGYAGKILNKVKRITALDPAGPIFKDMAPADRLDRSDASFVDVIHTNAELDIFRGFGLKMSIGHFDFYPNGGSNQPGCTNPVMTIWDLINHPKIDAKLLENVQCDHLRAIDLLICTIRNPDCKLYGVLCDSWENYIAGNCGTCRDGNAICVPLGIHSDQYASLIKADQSLNFYLNTSDSEPFIHQ